MTKDFQMVHKTHADKKCSLDFLSRSVEENVRAYHRSFPVYKETPLACLKETAKALGVSSIYVKDESYRFGLNAFKVLGGSYAMGHYLADKLGIDMKEVTYEKLTSEETRKALGDITFVTATDGNHGRGVAWTANQLRQHSVVYMPEGSAEERLMNIRAEGAEASITDLNYDDAVRLANRNAEEKGWVMVQDTAWEGYETIPRWIMQGYMTMAHEAVEDLKDIVPTHVFLQAGVGAMAGSITGFLARYYGKNMPRLSIVEPKAASCLYKTAAANDGKLHAVTGNLASMMAGLCCGEVCTLGWDVIKHHASHFFSVDDSVAAFGMRLLGNPAKGDPAIISGESGAVTMGLVYCLMVDPELTGMKHALGLTAQSIVLCISTEGDTDQENYRKVVWDGMNHS